MKTTFLNGYLEEEIYIEQPKDFVSEDSFDKVCRVNGSIYRLKQVSYNWNLHFH